MGERLPCKQEVTSSTLVFSTLIIERLSDMYLENRIQEERFKKYLKQDIRGNLSELDTNVKQEC